MNFDRSLIFAYLEEDNIQRAYFRVRPLLTLDGDIRQEAEQLWPNEGGLRIVPDRNEQHTFKVRMRTLGSYCVIDLRNQPAEAGKIRTNKNFKPDRGEVNQYILYSDTVHELPGHTFYQMLDGQAENFAEIAAQAVTPLFYIRQDDTVYGPVRKEAPALPETAKEMAGVLFEVPCPDGVSRVILCMEEAAPAAEVSKEDVPEPEEKAEPAEAPAQLEPHPEPEEAAAPEPTAVQVPEELPIGESLQILDDAKNHEETLEELNKPVSSGANLLRQEAAAPAVKPQNAPEKPLSGTPLLKTPLHVAAQQTKNRTQEVVTNQWSIGKYEPPAHNLPNGTAMRSVANPVETACSSLKAAWSNPNAHDQLVDCLFSMEGLRAKLEVKLCDGKSETVMQRVLRQRLQDLEAERLMALCELDKARRDLDVYKQELLTAMSARIARETGKLESDRQQAQNQVDALKTELNTLTIQRDALLARVNDLQSNALPEAIAKVTAETMMAAPISGVPLRMSPVSGQDAESEELISLMMEALTASGLAVDRNTAIALLVLLAISPRIGASCPTPAALSTLVRNIAGAFGWRSSFAHQYAAEQQPLIGVQPVDATPAILATNLPNYAPVPRATKLTLSRSTANLTRNAAYDVSQWPILMLPALPYVPEVDFGDAKPISAASIVKFAQKSFVSDAELNAVLGPVLRGATPLSGSARKDLYRFVSVCAGLMEGGLPVAADWGIMLWVVPALERGSRSHAAVCAALDEYPLSLKKCNPV